MMFKHTGVSGVVMVELLEGMDEGSTVEEVFLDLVGEDT